MVKAETPTVTVTEWNEQYYAPWIVDSPGGTVTTSAYNDGKKRCLSAEVGSGNPRKKISEQNKTFTRAFRKSGHRLSEDEIRAEAHRRQKEVRVPPAFYASRAELPQGVSYVSPLLPDLISRLLSVSRLLLRA